MKWSYLFAGLAALGSLALFAPAASSANGQVTVDIRVVTSAGKIVADRSVTTGPMRVRTSSRATCLGGKPRNGNKRIKIPSALGALVDLSGRIPRLDPLLLSGAFDFGIGVCGAGPFVAKGKRWWALKVNGKLASTGGDSTRVRNGDEVLWYLDRSWARPFPGELRTQVVAPVGESGVSVRVVSLDAVGKRSPASRARVFVEGAQVATTDRKGLATFELPEGESGRQFVTARLARHIPSNRVAIDVES